LVLAALLSLASHCGAQGPPLVQIGTAALAPKIDGVLDDACWERAAIITPFLLNDGSGPATQQTLGRLCWDDKALYLAFECYERALSPASQQLHLLKKTATNHDGRVFGDESLELFLRPGGTGSYYQLAANMLGTRYESRGTDPSFNGAWQAAATTGSESWLLEVMVPFSCLQVPTPKPSEEWTFNVCRNENPSSESSTWCGLEGAYHAPEQFGTLVFARDSVPVQPADLADLNAGAASLRLSLSGARGALQAAVRMKDGGTRQAKASIPAGARSVKLTYPAISGQTSSAMQYELALPEGTAVYRSPWFPQSVVGSKLTGELTLTDGPGRLLCNGRLLASLQPGRKTQVRTELTTGENVLAITAPGGASLSGLLQCGSQSFGLERGWRWSRQPAEGWDEPGFNAESWTTLSGPGQGQATLPDGEQVCLRRVVAVSSKRERFWPLQTDLNLPRDSQMFVRPLLNWVGDPPPDYVYYLDVPTPVRIITSDNLDGVQLEPIAGTPMKRQGQDYTRYAMAPVSTLTGGFTLELLWKNKASTNHQYVSALSLGGTFDWRDFSVELTSPSYAELVGVLCLKWQNRGIHGTCWYDNIALTEKGTQTNLLPQGDFEGEQWQGKPNLATYEREGKESRACRLSGTEEQVAKQAGLWASGPVIEVKPSTRYVLRLQAKGEGIVAKGGTGRAALLADVGSPESDRLTVYSHYEALDGQVVEVERASTLNILPAMKGRAPRRVPIIVCYSSGAYENPRVWQANAQMVLAAGINWLWGPERGFLADAVKPHGVKFVWHIPRDGFSQDPVDKDYLKRHPDHAALQRNGSKSPSQICPTILLDTENEFIPKLKEWLAERVKGSSYELVDWDHEFPVNYPSSVCLCPRCREAFKAYAKLPKTPSPEEIWRDHEEQWIAFRCGLNARMARIIRDACKTARPDVLFSVYSGFETSRTHSLYGVDWGMMRPVLDWAIAGYNGDRPTIQRTLKTVGGVPFTTGCMYVEKRFAAERPYPSPSEWRLRLLRATLDDEGNGFLVWYLPVLDGAGYWGIGWVSALVADFEDFFTQFSRDDALVQSEPPMDDSSLAVLTKGRERLIIAMNPSVAAKSVTLKLQGDITGCRLVEYETGATRDPAAALTLSLEPGEVKVLHLAPQ